MRTILAIIFMTFSTQASAWSENVKRTEVNSPVNKLSSKEPFLKMFMSKIGKIIIRNMMIVICICFPIYAIADYNDDYENYKLNQLNSGDFFNAYAFVLGQTEAIKKIEKDFPNSLIKGKSAFNSSFPSILEKMEAVARLNFGIEKIAEFKIDQLNNLYEHMNALEIDQRYIQKFDSEIIARSDGQIGSPTLENILSVQYYTNPVEEFFVGFKQNYSSKDHPKAKGVHVTFDVPKSWKGKEGKRPNTLKQWNSQNGWGFDMVNVVVTNLGFEPSLNQVKEYSQNEEELLEVIMRGFDLVEANFSFIENVPYVEIVSEGTAERAGGKIDMHMIQPQIFYKDKIITLTCSSKTNRKKQIKPVCAQILNSFVFPDLY